MLETQCIPMWVFLWVLIFACTKIVISEDPLILTPYLDESKIKEAQEKALVVPDMNGVKSYSGFFTVNKDCGSNLFFWFLPAQKDWKNAPVLLWLNGGPGTSSLLGLFMEIGPFNHLKKEGFVKNKYHWTKDKNVLFLDQPVGTGFSFSEKKCYAENMTVLAQETYNALEQFFTLFPNLQENSFFLTGQSFSGIFLPAIANEIIENTHDSLVNINLKGLIIVSPFIDMRCIRSSSYFYELGVIDEKVLSAALKTEEKFIKAITEEDYSAAYSYGNQISYQQWQFSKMSYTYHVLQETGPLIEYYLYIRNYKIREQIHVGQLLYSVDNSLVFNLLINKTLVPSVKQIQKILRSDKYVFGLFTGQLNANARYTSLPCVFDQLEWDGAKEYHAANRSEWYVGGRLAGWFKVGGNLFEAVVRGSGYYVPIDQPQAALDLVDAVVFREPGSKLLSTLHTEV